MAIGNKKNKHMNIDRMPEQGDKDQRVLGLIYLLMKEEHISIYHNQVSGKLPKFTDQARKHIYKKFSPSQHSFYEALKISQVGSPGFSLRDHVPRYVGVSSLDLSSVKLSINSDSAQKKEWISHLSQREDTKPIQPNHEEEKKYLIMENLIQTYQTACIMDIKLGQKLEKKKTNYKFVNSTTNSHHFRINGMEGYNSVTSSPIFVSKYYFQKTTAQEIQSHLAYFFYDGQKIDLGLLSRCTEITKEIVLALLNFKMGKFHSSSLLICYDANNHSNFCVKVIDFDKYHPDSLMNPDFNIIEGLKYIIGYFESILSNPSPHQTKFARKELRLFNLDSVVPQEKVEQYENKNSSC